jgi:hypothetical protein
MLSSVLGGDAVSTAIATGLGDVSAQAVADGGQGGWRGFDGAMRADATATSARLAVARGSANGDGANDARATSVLVPTGGSLTAATVALDAASADRGAYVATVARDLSFAASLPAFTGSSAVLDFDSTAPATGTLATLDITFGTLGETYGAGEAMTQRALVEMILTVPVVTDGSLSLDFPNLVVTGGGFDSLSLVVSLDDQALVEHLFTDVPAALAFFATTSIPIGALDAGFAGRLVYDLTMTSSTTNDGFSVGAVLNVVPEPSTGLLVIVGLVGIAVRRRRRS